MELEKMCRTCLSTKKEMRYIHSSITIANEDVRLSDILATSYNIKIADDPAHYPQNLCITCVHQLTITYSFKLLIKRTLKKLQDHVDRLDHNSDQDDCSFEYEQKSTEEFQYKKPDKSDDHVLLFCVHCRAEFQTKNTLIDHCSDNHPVRCDIGRDCDFCNEKFVDYQSLFLHKKLHLKPYVCEVCWEGFYTDIDLKNHSCETDSEKKSSKSLRQCDQCGKSYPAGYIRIHMLIHGDERRYSCKYCPKKYKVPCALNSHIIWSHKRTRNHKCEVCNAKFPTASAKSAHVRKTHLKETKYQCDSCERRFFSKTELNRHLLSHTGVKNFHCHLCDKSYQTRHGLNFHLKSHSEISM